MSSQISSFNHSAFQSYALKVFDSSNTKNFIALWMVTVIVPLILYLFACCCRCIADRHKLKASRGSCCAGKSVSFLRLTNAIALITLLIICAIFIALNISSFTALRIVNETLEDDAENYRWSSRDGKFVPKTLLTLEKYLAAQKMHTDHLTYVFAVSALMILCWQIKGCGCDSDSNYTILRCVRNWSIVTWVVTTIFASLYAADSLIWLLMSKAVIEGYVQIGLFRFLVMPCISAFSLLISLVIWCELNRIIDGAREYDDKDGEDHARYLRTKLELLSEQRLLIYTTMMIFSWQTLILIPLSKFMPPMFMSDDVPSEVINGLRKVSNTRSIVFCCLYWLSAMIYLFNFHRTYTVWKKSDEEFLAGMEIQKLEDKDFI